MIRELDFGALCSTLKRYRNKRVLLTFHTIGDRDAVSSAVALSKYLPNSKIVTPDFITSNARHMLEQAGCTKKISKPLKLSADVIVALDTNNYEGFGSTKEAMLAFKGETLFIDHHLRPRKIDKDVYMFNDEGYNSTASIVFELLKRLGAKVDRETAILLLNGIISDSAEFRNATALTFAQISELLGLASMQYSDILEYFRQRIPTESRFNLITNIRNARIERVGDYILASGPTSSVPPNVIADYILRLGVDAAVFWNIDAKEVSISARLRPPLDRELHIHLGLIMQGVKDLLKGNGGGHPCAAGAYGPNKPAGTDAVNRILDELRQKFRYGELG